MMIGGAAGLGPAWTRGQIEAPAGIQNMGSWTASVYTAEQQARLGVDGQGNQASTPLSGAPTAVRSIGPGMMIGGAACLGPAWTRGEIEQPAGTQNMGTWTGAVYTAQQQARLGVDAQGTKVIASGGGVVSAAPASMP